MRYCIDRIEGEYAVCEELEGGKKLKILLGSLPSGSGEGDVLMQENGCYIRDVEETAKRRTVLEERRKRLFAKGAGKL